MFVRHVDTRSQYESFTIIIPAWWRIIININLRFSPLLSHGLSVHAIMVLVVIHTLPSLHIVIAIKYCRQDDLDCAVYTHVCSTLNTDHQNTIVTYSCIFVDYFSNALTVYDKHKINSSISRNDHVSKNIVFALRKNNLCKHVSMGRNFS